MTLSRLLWISGTLVLGALAAILVSILRAEETQAHSDFRWFGTLGFPDVKGSPYVRIATGRWSPSEDEGPKNYYLNGFLVSSNATSFNVFTLDLSTRAFTNSLPGTVEHERVGFELLDLHQETERKLNELRARPGKADLWKRFGAQVPEEAEIFVLGWGCWRNGHDSDALSLYHEATKLPRDKSSPAKKATLKERVLVLADAVKARLKKMAQKDTPFREKLEKAIAHKLMWTGVLNFEDPSISRSELLRQFEAILRNYPHSEHVERARKTAEALRKMIAEDEAHGPPSELSGLSTNDQVKELIFQLRDQNGHQISQPGGCDIFMDWRGTTNTPAHRLVALGYAAVPQLIAALDSDTFSRSVGYHRDFYFSHKVLTVGDCASQILQRITGRSFFVPGLGYSSMSKDGKTSSARQAAEAWWSEFQIKGEKQMLIDSVSAGGSDARAQAELLVQKYPEAAAPALVRGAQSTTNSWVRTSLVDQIAKVPDPRGVEFLKKELLDGPTIETRVAAAFGLRQQKQAEAIPAMIREWEALSTEKKNNADDEGNDSEPLVEFLASCDSVETVSALARDLRTRTPDVKLNVIEALGETNRWSFNHKSEAQTGPTIEVIEKTLITALEDTEERMGMGGSRNGKNFSDPRICDMAACLLSERWPERYTFDLSAAQKIRDRQRRECANVWRVAHGLSTVPIPKSDTVRVGKNEATKVTSVEWSTEGAKPEPAFESRVSGLKGKKLNREDLLGLFTDFVRKPPSGTSGLEFKAIKDEDLTGVRLIVKLIPGSAPIEEQNWNVNERATLGRRNLHSSSGGGTLEAYSSKSHWEDFAEAIKQALAAPSDTPFEISVRLAATRSHSN